MSLRLGIPAFLALLAITPGRALGNGLVSHVHISELAVALLPPGELRDLLEDPDLFEVYRSGSIFPDTGYAADDAYGEMAHWEPFTEAYLQHIRERFPPPFESDEARRHVAYLMGVGSHSMADQWFDSLFMARVDQYDGSSANLDAASDPWLIVEQDVSDPIEGWVDAALMHEVFAARLGHEPGTEQIERGMDLVVQAINMLYLFADDLYEPFWLDMPWGATHYYLGEAAPGSLPHIAAAVARYWQVLWQRLHGADEPGDSFLMSWPPDGYVNFEVDPGSIEARMALAFGHGVDRETLEHARMRDESGVEVPSRVRFIYGSAFGNVVLVEPEEQLAYDTEYSIEVGTGVVLMDGRSLPEPVTVTVHTRCAPDRLDDCPPLPDPWEPPDHPPGRPDGGPDDDAGPDDAGDADSEAESARYDVTGGGCSGCGTAGRGNAALPFFVLLVGAIVLGRSRS